MPKNKFSAAIDTVPFPGKILTKDIYLGYETSTDTHKTIKALGAVAFLGAFSAVHAYQAKLGIESAAVHVPEMLDHGYMHDMLLSSVDAAYLTVNAAVAARQAGLAGTIMKKHAKWRKEKDVIPEEYRKKEKRPYKKFTASILAGAALTAAAQGVMYNSIQDAKDQTMDNKVAEFIEESNKQSEIDRLYDDNTIYLPPITTRAHDTFHE